MPTRRQYSLRVAPLSRYPFTNAAISSALRLRPMPLSQQHSRPTINRGCSDAYNCRDFLVARRWRNGVTCPRCESDNVLFLEKYNRWHCRQGHDAPQFTLKAGTIMEDSPIKLDKWLLAMWMVVNCKNGVSSYEIHRATGVTQKSAWFMNHRIRLALGMGPEERKLSGQVEVDETFIGGKARNMHKDVKARKITG